MLNFPTEPVDGDVYTFETQNFVFHSNLTAWLPEGMEEPINTAVDRNYTNFYLSAGMYVAIDTSVLDSYLAANRPNY